MEVYRSKFGAVMTITIVMLAALGVLFVYIGIRDDKIVVSAVAALLSVAAMLFLLALVFGTKYVFEDDHLNVRTIPRRNIIIPYADITSIKGWKNPERSSRAPAFSSDRVLIKYSDRSISISPVQKKEFIRELRRRCCLE